MAGSLMQIARPMTTAEIALKAQDFEFNPFIAMKYWLRTADTLLREAHIYQREGNDQQAYLLLMRYAALVAEKFPLHPSAKDVENRKGIKDANRTLPGVLDELETLKPRINARCEAWERALARRREASIALDYERSRPQSQSKNELAAAADPAVAGNTTTLAAAENSELAVKLAHKEIRRRDAARRGTRQAGVTEREEQERRTAGLWDDWEAALSRDSSVQDEDEMRRNMEASRRRMDGSHDIEPDGMRKRTPQPRPQSIAPTRNGSAYRYPSITRSQPYIYDDFDRRPSSRSQDLPPKPPKEPYPEELTDMPPPIPEKSAPAHLEPDTSSSKVPPTFTFRPSAYLENGEPLRTVFLPKGIREEFLRYAEPNTRRNLETCGMLCGTLISNALFISQVVIPDQKSTSDTCETTNDAAFFDYCEKEDLLQLGWIHTHPTQSCFMSSVDLHTHCAYQMMMKESVAIVCAPSKNPSWGVFRLTDPPGKQAVAKCRNAGLFHPHSEENIYTDALKPGHVFEAEGMEFSVVDLRT